MMVYLLRSSPFWISFFPVISVSTTTLYNYKVKVNILFHCKVKVNTWIQYHIEQL
jgi:hypothetical protein